MPYFMRALFAAQPVLLHRGLGGGGTFAVDAQWRLYLDPALLVGAGAWPVPVAGAVLLHEVGHLLRAHGVRGQSLPKPVHHVAWNYAADAEINDDLLAAGVGLPDGVITPQSFGCEDGGIAEDYYTHLIDPATGQQFPDDDDVGCGSGAGCAPVPGELGAAAGEVADGLDGAEADLVRRHVARAVQAAQGKGRGDAHRQGLARWAGEVLTPPTVPWGSGVACGDPARAGGSVGEDELQLCASVAAQPAGDRGPGDAGSVDHGVDCDRHVGVHVGR